MINIDEKQSKGTHWLSLFIDRNTAAHFDSFGIEYVPQEVLSKIKNKSITRSRFKIQSDDSIICGFYCVTFIEYVIAGKTLSDYTNLFSPNDYQKNDKIIYKYFNDKYGRGKSKVWLLNEKIDETRSYLLNEIKHNDLMSEKLKKVCRALNYRDQFLIFVSPVTYCVNFRVCFIIWCFCRYRESCNRIKNLCNQCRN